MKHKGLFFALGISMFLSCGIISFSGHDVVAKAEGTVDAGEISFSLYSGLAYFQNGIFLVGDRDNDIPTNWGGNMLAQDADCVVRNGENIQAYLKKHPDYSNGYYLALSDTGYGTRSIGERIELQGHWTITADGTTYNLTVNKFSAFWSGNAWVEDFEWPELETYDKVSLAQAGFDDFDRVVINEDRAPEVSNTFALSEGNTTSSFAFEFIFESFGEKVDKTVEIRIGNSAAGSPGHNYHLVMNNKWGSKGVIVLYEKNGDTILKSSGDINCDLTAGSRHTIEFGSIYLKNSTETFNYVKYDGNCYAHFINTPASHERTTRVALYYPGDNIFLGSSMPQKEANYELTFDKSDERDGYGIYLNGTENNVPFKEGDWSYRGAPAITTNATKNGQPLYNKGQTPLVKHGSVKYYLVFKDFGITFVDGDVVTIGGEFHFYISGKAYAISVKPISFVYEDGLFSLVNDIVAFLIDKLDSRYPREFYDDDKAIILNQIIEEAAEVMEGLTSNKELWDTYYQYVEELDLVPVNEEKAAEQLANAKETAIATLNNYVSEDNYEESNYSTIQGYIADAINQINAATSISEVNNIVNATKVLIDAVPTRQASIEQKILSFADGYEEYLKQYEVVTTTDLNMTGDLKFFAMNSKQKSCSTGGKGEYSSTIPTSSDNLTGNMVFQFVYSSTNPSSNKYGSQLFIRLRGDGANCYRFAVGSTMGEGTGVGVATFVGDHAGNEQNARIDFVADQKYEIKLGAIDLKNYDRTLLYIEVNGEVAAKEIVDSIDFETSPSILIMDSHVADIPEDAPEGFVEDYITISALEEDTTKGNYATILGRLILDNSSSSSSLVVYLKNDKSNLLDNDKLLPLENGAFLVNGQEINSDRPSESNCLIKGNGNKFTVCYKFESLQDGDEIVINGLYSKFLSDSKEVYRFLTSKFIYHASTESWEQEPPSLDIAKAEAIESLNNYVNPSDYSEDNQNAINAIIDEYVTKINAATSNQEVDELFDEATLKINAVQTILGQYKDYAKEELNSYKSPAIYRDDEKAELEDILADAFAQIDKCNDKASVDLVVIDVKDRIDEIKTAAQYDAEELAAAKKAAKAEIERYVGLLELNRYSDESVSNIQKLALDARNAVDSATSADQIEQIVNSFKESIKDVKTNDGSTFNGEGYNNPSSGSAKKCGGNIISTSVILSAISLMGIALLFLKKKENY